MWVVVTAVLAIGVIQTLFGPDFSGGTVFQQPNPAAIASTVIQLIHVVPAWRRPIRRWGLAAQYALLPFGGATEFAAASTLLLLPAPARWILLPVAPLCTALLWYGADPVMFCAQVGNAMCLALVIFALTRLVQTRDELTAASTALAQERVAGVRARASHRLENVIATALVRIPRLTARGDGAGIARLAREAAAHARNAPDAGDTAPPPVAETMTPQLTLPIVVIAHAQAVGFYLVFLARDPLPPATRLTLILAAVAAVGLHLYHLFPRLPHRRPPWYGLTITIHIVVACLPLVVTSRPHPELLVFAAASTLAVLRPAIAWPLCTAFTALVCAAGIVGGDSAALVTVATVNMIIGVAGFHGLAQLTWMVYETRATRRQLAEIAETRERHRIRRDVHDLLGSSLSAIALRADIADRPDDFDEIAAAAREALRQLRAIPSGDPRLDLDTELRKAGELLTAAGIEARVRVTARPRDAEAAALAVVVREAITNVLRHTDADGCEITLDRDDGAARLRIVNDGAAASPGTGNGLANLGERLTALGGDCTARRDGERFEVLARLAAPSPVAVATGDP